MPIKTITGPIVEPVTLAEAKAHLRVDFPEDDSYISSLISVARDFAEGYQKRSLALQTLELTLDDFCQGIQLLRPPIVSVTSITYKTLAGVDTVLPATDYIAAIDSECIIPAVDKIWPTILYPVDAVKVRYQAGYTPATIPQSTKQAILLLIGHWYENREAVTIGKAPTTLPLAVDALLSLDRVY